MRYLFCLSAEPFTEAITVCDSEIGNSKDTYPITNIPYLRDFNDNYRGGISEVTSGPDSDGPAIHMHHIFPEAQYPEISFYLENIIALTPTQHLAYAHPMGNTQVVSSEYQQICLLAKSSTIEENLGGEEEYVIYEFVRLLFVLDTGFSTEEFSEIEDMDFNGVIAKINLIYAE